MSRARRGWRRSSNLGLAGVALPGGMQQARNSRHVWFSASSPPQRFFSARRSVPSVNCSERGATACNTALYIPLSICPDPTQEHWPWRPGPGLGWGSRPLTPPRASRPYLAAFPRDLLCLWLADSVQQVSISQQPTNIRATPGAGLSQVPTLGGPSQVPTRDPPGTTRPTQATSRGSSSRQPGSDLPLHPSLPRRRRPTARRTGH